jgi:hypothetical protein
MGLELKTVSTYNDRVTSSPTNKVWAASAGGGVAGAVSLLISKLVFNSLFPNSDAETVAAGMMVISFAVSFAGALLAGYLTPHDPGEGFKIVPKDAPKP